MCRQILLVLFPYFLALVSTDTVPQTLSQTALLTVHYLPLSLQLYPATRVVILDSYSMATSRGLRLTLGTKSATAAARAMCWRVTLPCPALPLQQGLLPGISPSLTAEVCRGNIGKLSIITGLRVKSWSLFVHQANILITSNLSCLITSADSQLRDMPQIIKLNLINIC